jgi:calcium-dependent protein kinase
MFDKVKKFNLIKCFSKPKFIIQDGSGSISLEEVKEVFGGSGLVADKVWNDIINEVDKD